MTTRTRWIVLLVSTPVVAFVVIGSLLGRTLASQGAYEHLRVFEDVVSLVDAELRRAGQRRQGDERRDARPRRWARRRQRLPDAGAGQDVRGRARAATSGTHRPRADPRLLPARRLGPRRLAGGPRRPAHRRLRPRHQRRADAQPVGARGHAPAARRRSARRSPSPSCAAAPPIRATSPLVREAAPATDVTSQGADAGRRLRARRGVRPGRRRPPRAGR